MRAVALIPFSYGADAEEVLGESTGKPHIGTGQNTPWR
jgi:hypothetical protein